MHAHQSSFGSRPLRSTTRAAAAAGMALMTANADIVYVDELNVTVSSAASKGGAPGPLVEVPVELGGVPVFIAKVQSQEGVSPPTVIGFSDFVHGFQAFAGGKEPGQIISFNEGATISGSPVSQTNTNLATIWSAANAAGVSADPGYLIGFEFNPTGTRTLYGWMELRFDWALPVRTDIILTRYAYDDSGAPIAAGQTFTAPEGGIVFRDGLNLTASESKGSAAVTSVDIDNDGEVDFELRSNPSNNEIGFSGVTNFDYIVTGGTAGEAYLFAEGETIAGPITPFVDATALSSWFLGAADGDTAYVGFGFFVGADERPGWVELRRDNAQTLTLTRLAYHNEDGDITAGQTGHPPLQVLATEYVADAGGGTPEFRVTVPGRDGFVYQLRRSPDLASPFVDIGTPLAGADSSLELTDPNPLPRRGFYEVAEDAASP